LVVGAKKLIFVEIFVKFEIFDHFGSRSTHLAPENSDQAPVDLMTVEKQEEEGTQP
tara:strand:+ start:301 stop:468 length:168 start_codon:yes stop_codon:yes gene_type:complete